MIVEGRGLWNGAKIRIFWDRESAEGAKRLQPGLIGPGIG